MFMNLLFFKIDFIWCTFITLQSLFLRYIVTMQHVASSISVETNRSVSAEVAFCLICCVCGNVVDRYSLKNSDVL